MMEYREIIHDGNIYYDTPCNNRCGIGWLTEEEINNGHLCDDCPTEEK